MEQLIIIFLLIIIMLILIDRKFLINIRGKNHSDTNKSVPSIMGATRQREGQILPISARERQYESALMAQNNFESETKEEEFDPISHTENINDILARNDDWGQEDEDWKYEDSTIESGFATGVTFQELSTASQLLQQHVLEPDLEQQAADIIQRIQGTELFDLLENSLGDASKRIATLLTASIPDDNKIISSRRNNSSDSFDIGEFV
ncbi:hypothetical protein [Chryseobacterium aquifrigidense]|uniref:Conjugal transfer protein TraD n=1 Tax=Chryseobacterium aquifrigidense TaxID=558021 RepID=A0A543EJM5_9FLAO|nr:hypothetical protein [Chryseobacterium aquifrigidense]TQM21729.1 hypothetical protein FB551_1423 [Chryseobacterium aquifrigidense]